MNKETKFFVYLLERYADYKGISAPEVLAQWDGAHLTEKIYSLYDLYHVECLQNAFDDIDSLTKAQSHNQL